LGNNTEELARTLTRQARLQADGSLANFLRVAVLDGSRTSLIAQHKIEAARLQLNVWDKIREVNNINRKTIITLRLQVIRLTDENKVLQVARQKCDTCYCTLTPANTDPEDHFLCIVCTSAQAAYNKTAAGPRSSQHAPQATSTLAPPSPDPSTPPTRSPSPGHATDLTNDTTPDDSDFDPDGDDVRCTHDERLHLRNEGQKLRQTLETTNRAPASLPRSRSQSQFCPASHLYYPDTPDDELAAQLEAERDALDHEQRDNFRALVEERNSGDISEVLTAAAKGYYPRASKNPPPHFPPPSSSNQTAASAAPPRKRKNKKKKPTPATRARASDFFAEGHESPARDIQEAKRYTLQVQDIPPSATYPNDSNDDEARTSSVRQVQFGDATTYTFDSRGIARSYLQQPIGSRPLADLPGVLEERARTTSSSATAATTTTQPKKKKKKNKTSPQPPSSSLPHSDGDNDPPALITETQPPAQSRHPGPSHLPGVYTWNSIANRYTLNLSESERLRFPGRLGRHINGGHDNAWRNAPNPQPPHHGWPLPPQHDDWALSAQPDQYHDITPAQYLELAQRSANATATEAANDRLALAERRRADLERGSRPKKQ
jgi:hypothetical protein